MNEQNFNPYLKPNSTLDDNSNNATKEEMEEAVEINEELDGVLAGGRYTKVQETADLVVKKRDLNDSFKKETGTALASLPEGKEPTMQINEKAISNLYMAGHLFGKDFTMEHIANCLAKGEEVTEQMKHPAEGSRYFKLDIPDGAGLPGRFVVPQENGTTLAEHIANWNQECEFKFRHGQLSPIIKKKELPQWLVDLESVFYVIMEKNQMPDGKLQIADGPTDNDPEESWVVSTVHYGQPSRVKPRPPRKPDWKKAKKDPDKLSETMINHMTAIDNYQKDYDSWSDEQKRVVFVDLEEDGVGQEGVKKEKKTNNAEKDNLISELSHDNEVLKKMLMQAMGEMNEMKSEMKGINKRLKKRDL